MDSHKLRIVRMMTVTQNKSVSSKLTLYDSCRRNPRVPPSHPESLHMSYFCQILFSKKVVVDVLLFSSTSDIHLSYPERISFQWTLSSPSERTQNISPSYSVGCESSILHRHTNCSFPRDFCGLFLLRVLSDFASAQWVGFHFQDPTSVCNRLNICLFFIVGAVTLHFNAQNSSKNNLQIASTRK